MSKGEDLNDNLWLRKAVIADMQLLFCWVNDPQVRSSAFCSEQIPLSVHRQWFENALMDKNVQIYILQRGDLPIGQVRLKCIDREYFLDYSVDAAWRGRGYGIKILQLVERKLSLGVFLLGEVKLENIASRHVFESLGYQGSPNAMNDYIIYKKCIVDSGREHSFV